MPGNVFAPSADNQTCNYDTECSNHHPSLSTLRSKGLSRVRWNGELYIHKNLAVNIVVRLPHPRSTDSQSLYYYNISKRSNVSKIKILSGLILVKMLKVI